MPWLPVNWYQHNCFLFMKKKTDLVGVIFATHLILLPLFPVWEKNCSKKKFDTYQIWNFQRQTQNGTDKENNIFYLEVSMTICKSKTVKVQTRKLVWLNRLEPNLILHVDKEETFLCGSMNQQQHFIGEGSLGLLFLALFFSTTLSTLFLIFSKHS